MKDGTEVPLSKPDGLNFYTVTLSGTKYDLMVVPKSFRSVLMGAVMRKHISETGLKYVLSRAGDITNVTDSHVSFKTAPHKYVYNKRWSLPAKLFMLGGIGALVGAYYHREALKPIAQSFWNEQVMPRASALYGYLVGK
jgi:hypothetical protein